MFLSDEAFSTVVAGTPLISIDLVVENTQGEVLLGMRTNRPAKDFWFVPGGRVLKGEALDHAFQRLTKAELNIQLERIESEFLGVFEHFYSDSALDSNISTHYVVLAYRVTIDSDLADLPLQQHNAYKWFSVSQLKADAAVHLHTKWYFDDANSDAALP